MIIEYADGDLPQKYEDELFMALSSDESLRQSFRSALKFNSAIKQNADLFRPDPASKVRIFSAVGATIPAGDRNKFAKNRFFLFLNKQSAAWPLAMIALAAAIVLLFRTPEESSKETLSAVDESNYPIVESFEMPLPFYAEKQALETKTRTIIKYIYKEKSAETLASLDNPINSNVILESYSAIPENSFGSKMQTMPGNIDFQGMAYPWEISSEKTGFSVELRNSLAWNMPEANISPDEISKLNNFSIGINYDLTENITVLVNARQETFFQVFEGTEENGKRFIYEQQPNLTSFGAGLRYYIPAGNTLRPMVQISAGGNRTGALGRAAIGLEYNPYRDFSFLLGIEYSGLTYEHQNKSYYSDKGGAYLTLKYNF